eukprot:1256406-Pyramimonas_sp.AAC.1
MTPTRSVEEVGTEGGRAEAEEADGGSTDRGPVGLWGEVLALVEIHRARERCRSDGDERLPTERGRSS